MINFLTDLWRVESQHYRSYGSYPRDKKNSEGFLTQNQSTLCLQGHVGFNTVVSQCCQCSTIIRPHSIHLCMDQRKWTGNGNGWSMSSEMKEHMRKHVHMLLPIEPNYWELVVLNHCNKCLSCISNLYNKFMKYTRTHIILYLYSVHT